MTCSSYRLMPKPGSCSCGEAVQLPQFCNVLWTPGESRLLTVAGSIDLPWPEYVFESTPNNWDIRALTGEPTPLSEQTNGDDFRYQPLVETDDPVAWSVGATPEPGPMATVISTALWWNGYQAPACQRSASQPNGQFPVDEQSPSFGSYSPPASIPVSWSDLRWQMPIDFDSVETVSVQSGPDGDGHEHTVHVYYNSTAGYGPISDLTSGSADWCFAGGDRNGIRCFYRKSDGSLADVHMGPIGEYYNAASYMNRLAATNVSDSGFMPDLANPANAIRQTIRFARTLFWGDGATSLTVDNVRNSVVVDLDKSAAYLWDKTNDPFTITGSSQPGGYWQLRAADDPNFGFGRDDGEGHLLGFARRQTGPNTWPLDPIYRAPLLDALGVAEDGDAAYVLYCWFESDPPTLTPPATPIYFEHFPGFMASNPRINLSVDVDVEYTRADTGRQKGETVDLFDGETIQWSGSAPDPEGPLYRDDDEIEFPLDQNNSTLEGATAELTATREGAAA